MSEYSLFTSESVSEGHPDKMADQISDAILDAIIGADPHARVAVETLVKTGMAVIAAPGYGVMPQTQPTRPGRGYAMMKVRQGGFGLGVTKTAAERARTPTDAPKRLRTAQRRQQEIVTDR